MVKIVLNTPKAHLKYNQIVPQIWASPKFFQTIINGDNVKLLVKTFRSGVTVRVVLFKASIFIFLWRLFVYGGYQILNGSLEDFYSIDLNDHQPKFTWKQIKGKNGINPGARSKHALVGGK